MLIALGLAAAALRVPASLWVALGLGAGLRLRISTATTSCWLRGATLLLLLGSSSSWPTAREQGHVAPNGRSTTRGLEFSTCAGENQGA